MEMFKAFFSGGNRSKEVLQQATTLEMLLASEDPRDLVQWFKKRAAKLDQSFVDMLTEVSSRLLSQMGISSTQQLLRLNLLIGELLHDQLHTIARNLDESSQFQLLFVQRQLEEDGVGPRPVNARDADDVYKRVYNYRGCYLAEHGHFAASIEHFNVTLNIDPHFAPAYCNRARAYVELGQLEDAWADCLTLHSFDPSYPEGRATYQLVETLRRLRESRQGSLVEIAREHGLLDLLRRYDRPLKPGEYASSLGREINPLEATELPKSNTTPEQLNHQGVVRGRSGDYAGAIEAFNRALELNPEYLEPYYNRGKAYLLAGAYEKAIADFSSILDKEPGDIEAHGLREQAYEKLGREKRPGDIPKDSAYVSSETRQIGEVQSEKGSDDDLKKKNLPADSSTREIQELPDESDDLSYAGQSAPARPQAVAAARRLLYPEGLDIASTTANATAEGLYHEATALRKSGGHHEAVSLYLTALAYYVTLDQLDYMSACLNGLGICYKELIREALKLELTSLISTRSSTALRRSAMRYAYQIYQLAYKGVGDLAEKGRACHRWSLELHKRMGNLAGQANQISNLAMIEELLGNLDTARRYQLWALQTHREAGKPADAAIDLMKLADIDHHLGDERAAATWERQAQEIDHAIQP